MFGGNTVSLKGGQKLKWDRGRKETFTDRHVSVFFVRHEKKECFFVKGLWGGGRIGQRRAYEEE